MTFGQRLKDLREEKNLTQEELGKLINVSKPSISRYEAGTNEPNIGIIHFLADYFRVSVDYLLGRSDTRNPEKEKVNPAYFRIMKDAEQKGIPPEDIQDAIMLLERARKRDEEAKRRKEQT